MELNLKKSAIHYYNLGFNVTHIYRLYNDSLLKKFVKRILFYSLFRVLGIDFAKQIIVVAEKP